MMPVSLDELNAPPAPVAPTQPAAPASRGISLDSLNTQDPAPAPQEPHPDTWLGRTLDSVKAFGAATADSPGKTALGLGKAVVGGAVDLADLGAQGLTAIAFTIKRAVGEGGFSYKGFREAFPEGMKAAQEVTTQVRDVAAAVTKINLAPEGKEDEAAAGLLALLPKTQQAITEGIYDKSEPLIGKTGAIIAEAGSSALLTFLMLKPGLAVKAFGRVLEVSRGEPVSAGAKADVAKVNATFDELAVKNPEAADALVDHIKISDEDLGDHFKERAVKAQAKSPEDIGKIQAQAMSAPVEPPKFKQVGTTETGKPRVRSMTMEEVQDLMPDAVSEGFKDLNEPKPIPPGAEDAVMFTDQGSGVTRSSVKAAFNIGETVTDKLPGVGVLKGKLTEYYDQILRKVNPEGLGPEAKVGAAVLAKNIAVQMQKDSSFFVKSATRRSFWNHRLEEAPEFISKFEKGEGFADPVFNDVAAGYRNWSDEIYAKEKSLGFDYDPVDHYLYHLFEDGDKATAFFEGRYGPKWKDPKFTKDRQFSMYEQAVKNGLKPKFSNPEDIMLARQHASSIAEMRVNSFDEMEKYGLARKVKASDEGHPADFPSVQWRSPTGQLFWVQEKASAVMHNAFNTESLWSEQGLRGDAFRGAMFLKNAIVPVKLGFSLFHPLHVATIDNAASAVRISKEMLAGKKNPVAWLAQMTQASVYGAKGVPLLSLWDNPRTGWKVLQAYRGKVDEAKLGAADQQSLQYMAEGGMIPELSAEMKNKSMQNLKDSIAKRSLSAVWHLPFAMLEMMQKPIFEHWIPSLKVASYLADVKSALKVDPTLIDHPQARITAFRQLAKSVDNRYGEMAYNTLFMDKFVKDIAVANTLSLGWQMGFLREYGGGLMDMGRAVGKTGGLGAKAAKGMLDRPLFVAFYTSQALMYGGLMTWAFTGKAPEDLMDYIYPQVAPLDEDGKASRVNTMFYTREFASIYKHIENEGVASGLGHLVASKSSGLIGLVAEWATGVNSMGQEIRDPDAPAYKKVEQTLANSLSELEPISFAAAQKGSGSGKESLLAGLGFTPAPKYVNESKTEGAIKSTYQRYYASKQTPYEKAEYSKDAKEMKRAYDNGDMEKYSELSDKMQEAYGVTQKEQRNIERNIVKGTNPTFKMFERFDWHQQKKLLDSMSEDERDSYLPHSNREHLRFNYEPPE